MRQRSYQVAKKKSRDPGMTAEQWNAAHPAGTRVRYQPVKGIEVFEETKTRSDAWEICGHACVMIEGRTGGSAIDHMTVLPDATP